MIHIADHSNDMVNNKSNMNSIYVCVYIYAAPCSFGLRHPVFLKCSTT